MCQTESSQTYAKDTSVAADDDDDGEDDEDRIDVEIEIWFNVWHGHGG